MIKKKIKREQNIKENIQNRKKEAHNKNKVANQNNPANVNVHIRVCSPQEIQEAVGKLKNKLGLIISYKSEITNLKDRIGESKQTIKYLETLKPSQDILDALHESEEYLSNLEQQWKNNQIGIQTFRKKVNEIIKIANDTNAKEIIVGELTAEENNEMLNEEDDKKYILTEEEQKELADIHESIRNYEEKSSPEIPHQVVVQEEHKQYTEEENKKIIESCVETIFKIARQELPNANLTTIKADFIEQCLKKANDYSKKVMANNIAPKADGSAMGTR